MQREKRKKKFLRKLDILHLSQKLKAYLIEESAFILLCAPVFFGSLLGFNLGISKRWPLSFTFCQKWTHLKQDHARGIWGCISWRPCHGVLRRAACWKSKWASCPQFWGFASLDSASPPVTPKYVLCFLHSMIQWDV